MPHVNFLELDKAVLIVAKEWEKTPQFVGQLCRTFKYEKDRRRDMSIPQPKDIDPAVWCVWSRWISHFGLAKAAEASELLSDRMFPPKRKK